MTHISYELAKKLKDAGFPFDFGKCEHLYEANNVQASELSFHMLCEQYPSPSLSELIEACGDTFSQLNKWDRNKEPSGRWNAVADIPYNESEDSVSVRTDAATPEEAVAHLWLAVKEQQK